MGALRATNTWDYPAYLGLSVVTLGLLAWDRRRRGASWTSAVGGWALAALGLFLLSTLLFLPFTRNFATDYAGFTLWRGTHTLVRDYLKLHGLWLFLLCSAAVALYHRAYGIRPLAFGADRRRRGVHDRRRRAEHDRAGPAGAAGWPVGRVWV